MTDNPNEAPAPRHEHHWQPFDLMRQWTDAPFFWCPTCQIVMDAAAVKEWGRMWQENAAMREIVAAVADGWSNALGTRIGETPADGLALKSRARALLGTQTPGTTDDATAQEG